MVQDWLKNNHVDVLDWPPNSPDLNIIEHVWAYLKLRVRSRNPLPKSEADLWVALQEEWYGIDLAFIQSLYESLPSRVHAVYKANGGNTQY
jgi:transposase